MSIYMNEHYRMQCKTSLNVFKSMLTYNVLECFFSKFQRLQRFHDNFDLYATLQIRMNHLLLVSYIVKEKIAILNSRMLVLGKLSAIGGAEGI